ncbi:MAG: hypothetical protein IPL52_07735 [Flavobacteriales bacterium]|nr:hypothetical protein [Flavobacteriales bacterium]
MYEVPIGYAGLLIVSLRRGIAYALGKVARIMDARSLCIGDSTVLGLRIVSGCSAMALLPGGILRLRVDPDKPTYFHVWNGEVLIGVLEVVPLTTDEALEAGIQRLDIGVIDLDAVERNRAYCCSIKQGGSLVMLTSATRRWAPLDRQLLDRAGQWIDTARKAG